MPSKKEAVKVQQKSRNIVTDYRPWFTRYH